MYYNFGDIKFAYGTYGGLNTRGEGLGYFTEITSNGETYNSTNTTETTGSNLFIPAGVKASVRILTLPEMNKMLGRADIDSIDTMTDPTGANGLFVLENIKNITEVSSYIYDDGFYWLASPVLEADNWYSVCTMDFGGNVDYYDLGETGVRPVICLKSNVNFTEDGNGVLKID